MKSGEYSYQEKIVRAYNKKYDKEYDGEFEKDKISQATVSRYLKQLGVVKNDDKIFVFTHDKQQRKAKDDLKQKLENNKATLIRPSSMIAIRTKRGQARSIGVEIEEVFKGIVWATLADDDTVAIFFSSETTAEDFLKEMKQCVDVKKAD